MNDAQTADRFFSARLNSTWSLLRQEVLYILWALAEIALITPFVLAFMPWARFWPPWQFALFLLLLMLVPFNLSRLASLLKAPVDKQQIVLVAGLIITVLVTWRVLLYETNSLFDLRWLGEIAGHFANSDNPAWTREVALFLTVTLVWWRGISLIGRRVDIGDVGLRLRTGVLLAAFFVAGLAGSQLPWSVTPFILLFFFTSLAGIVLTRIEHLELSRTGQSFPVGPRWFLTVFSMAGLVVFISGILAGFAGGDSITGVMGFMAPLWKAVHFMAASVASTLSFMSIPLFIMLGWLINLLLALFGPILQTGFENLDMTIPPPLVTPAIEEALEVTKTVNQTPRQLITVLVMLFFVLLVALALGRYFRSLRQTAQFQSERISPFEGLAPIKRPGLGRRILNRVGLLRRWRAAASIRQIYREMCQSAAANGYPRLNTETPYEYLATLNKAWPLNETDTRLITEAFNRVRYGQVPETAEELGAIADAWTRLQSTEPEAQLAEQIQVDTLAK